MALNSPAAGRTAKGPVVLVWVGFMQSEEMIKTPNILIFLVIVGPHAIEPESTTGPKAGHF